MFIIFSFISHHVDTILFVYKSTSLYWKYILTGNLFGIRTNLSTVFTFIHLMIYECM